ncbi:hypothetical protein JTB14_000785 [Gonioctena quinquepunctata]|nr:hypothetical protein JTB14_000785 [Gonioctena quinquepunctata]
MADSEDHNKVAPDKKKENIGGNIDFPSENNIMSSFYECSAKKCRIVVSIRCYSMFHPSCCEIKKLVILDNFRVICCKTEPVSGNNTNNEEEILKLESNLLKILLAEMEEQHSERK